MIKPCNCAKENKDRSTLDNMRRLAGKMASMEGRIYVIILKMDGTCTFEPMDAIGSKGEIVEYVHYL